MHKLALILPLFTGLICWAATPNSLQAAGSAEITFESLLDQMTDLRRLTELPLPAYQTRQFSSYDRKSKTPDDAEGWFANADAGHYLHIEENSGRKEYVMMDADGPGAIVRIWSANPRGRLRIYLDGDKTPALEGDMQQILKGEFKGLPQPLAGVRGKGWNLYLPIPYAKHCKVTSDQPKFYYHVNYLDRLLVKIADLAVRLNMPRDANKPWPANMKKDLFDSYLSPGETKTINRVKGPRAYGRILFLIATDQVEVAARSIVLRMYFDGEQTVESPLGDFSGTAPGLTYYESLPLGISGPPSHIWCHWIMPFRNSAKITVTNMGNKIVRVHGSASHVPYQWTDRSLLFHARWRIEHDIPTRPFIDWTHLQCRGVGRFVGGSLHIINPQRGWWGEGDEKIYVDGETFPSHIGTGTEDYYGYAWGSNERFAHAYHSQPRCDGPKSYGNTSVNRFHTVDDIPFNKSFKFDIENRCWNAKIKLTRAAVSYWYARPGGSDFFKPITKQDVQWIEIPKFIYYNAPGAIDAEDMKVIRATIGETYVGDADPRYNSEKQLVWSKVKTGGKLILEFAVPETLTRNLYVRLTKAPHCPKVQFYVNDARTGQAIDLVSEEIEPTDEIDLGQMKLNKGPNNLTVEIVEEHQTPGQDCSFGIDYVIVK
ncbi:MAG: DUF2961 domain-containing protein [Planctomycetota bacterium]|jgi:hypothetical protein